jgi:hypothetical protein
MKNTNDCQAAESHQIVSGIKRAKQFGPFYFGQLDLGLANSPSLFCY